jgi:hypothetical protein
MLGSCFDRVWFEELGDPQGGSFFYAQAPLLRTRIMRDTQ